MRLSGAQGTQTGGGTHAAQVQPSSSKTAPLATSSLRIMSRGAGYRSASAASAASVSASSFCTWRTTRRGRPGMASWTHSSSTRAPAGIAATTALSAAVVSSASSSVCASAAATSKANASYSP